MLTFRFSKPHNKSRDSAVVSRCLLCEHEDLSLIPQIRGSRDRRIPGSCLPPAQPARPPVSERDHVSKNEVESD